MPTINDDYVNALLADATYALDESASDGFTKDKLIEAITKRMTPTLAEYIGNNFTKQ